MSSGHLEQIQDMIAEEIERSLLVLDTFAGVSGETRLNAAIDFAVADGYSTALGDVIEALEAAGHSLAAELIKSTLLTRFRRETSPERRFDEGGEP